MTNPTWLIQIYQMSDPATQAAATALLSTTHGFTTDARTSAGGCFLTVECADPTQALGVYELVMMIDQHAELIHSITGPPKRRASPSADLQDVRPG